jgi:fluoride exporter
LARTLIAIALGSALGGVLRYLLGGLVHLWWARSFPWGTLTVNVVGSTLIGFAWVLLATRGEAGETARAFIIIGLLGGFTTFSSFSMETLLLIEQNAWGRAASYVGLSIVACLAGAWAGLGLGRNWLA